MIIRTINDVESFNERLQNGDILMNKFVSKAPYKPTEDQPQAENPSKRFGIAEGKFVVPDDFDDCNDEIAEMFGVK